MNKKSLLFESLCVYAVLAFVLRIFARPAFAKPVANSASYDAIDAYVEAHRQRLNMPGVSLAIVEGDSIAHLRSFGQARPDGQAPTSQTPFVIGSLTKSFTLIPMLGKRRGYLMLYMPDYAWSALVCGSFAGIWASLRTGLILQILRRCQASNPSLGGR